MLLLTLSTPHRRWAAGVSLFELYTGKIMFQGNSNNHMLKLIQEVRRHLAMPTPLYSLDAVCFVCRM